MDNKFKAKRKIFSYTQSIKEIQFVRVDTFRTIRYYITLTEQKDGSTKAQWVQIITALNEKGKRILQKMTPEIYALTMSNIEKC